VQYAVNPDVRRGMRLAVTAGTANPSWTKLPTQIAVAGKTGTAEFCDWSKQKDGTFGCRRDKEGHLLTHAWFVAFAPYDNPEIALAVMVDGSGLSHIIEGSQVAAPVAGDVLRAYFHLPPPAPAVLSRPTACPTCPTPAPGAATDGVLAPSGGGD
jgi:penicillin-binding protein 2